MHIYPTDGVLEWLNWEYSVFPWWRNLLPLNTYRISYPATREQVARSIALCQRWCDRENAKEERGRALEIETAELAEGLRRGQ
jgi:hypothetical protein